MLALGLSLAGGGDTAGQALEPVRVSLQDGAAPLVPAIDDTQFERQPYRIRVILVFDDQATFTSHFRRWLVERTAELIRSTIGDPWQAEIVEGGSQLGRFFSEPMKDPGEELSQGLTGEVEKVFLVRLGADGAHYQLSAREYDVAIAQWSPRRHRTSAIRDVLDREVLQVCLAIFAPLAKPVARPQPGGARLILKGGALVTADPTVRLVQPDAVFGLVRLFRKDRGMPAQTVDWTYFVVQDVNAGTLDCRLLSAYRDPTTSRAPGSELLAVLQRPGPAGTKLRFLDRQGSPLAGYDVHLSDIRPTTEPRLLTTDYQGTVTLPSTDNLLSVVLRSGTQTLVRLWVLPGTIPGRKEVVVHDDPVRFQVESRLTALQDAIIDEVARRTLTIRRVHALMERDRWEQARTSMDRRDASLAPFQNRLDQARAEALRLATERGNDSLPSGVKKMLDETQNYIDVLLQPTPMEDLRAEYESRYRAFRTRAAD